jgi:7,8-dihydropterin-6-yl-methyl-4-(beta-D-ribofuranosyl)aminobenzene 5'-phosphate synthase
MGIGFERQKLTNDMKFTLCLEKNFPKISDGIYFSGEIDRTTDFEKNDPDVVIQSDSGFVQDVLLDDTSVLIETDSGPVIISG